MPTGAEASSPRMQLFPIDAHGATAAPIAAADAVVAGVIAATVTLYARKGHHPPWLGYLAVEDGLCVGTCGFAGPPAGGEVEIAYFAFPAHEGRGVATRMARELMRISRPAVDDGGLAFIAHTLPLEGPSTAILRKLGFALEGEITHPEDGRIWKWRAAR